MLTKHLDQKEAKSLFKKYKEQEAINDHASNLVLLAEAYGTETECKTCLFNRETQDRLGESNRLLAREALEAANKYYINLFLDATYSFTAGSIALVKQ